MAHTSDTCAVCGGYRAPSEEVAWRNELAWQAEHGIDGGEFAHEPEGCLCCPTCGREGTGGQCCEPPCEFCANGPMCEHAAGRCGVCGEWDGMDKEPLGGLVRGWLRGCARCTEALQERERERWFYETQEYVPAAAWAHSPQNARRPRCHICGAEDGEMRAIASDGGVPRAWWCCADVADLEEFV